MRRGYRLHTKKTWPFRECKIQWEIWKMEVNDTNNSLRGLYMTHCCMCIIYHILFRLNKTVSFKQNIHKTLFSRLREHRNRQKWNLREKFSFRLILHRLSWHLVAPKGAVCFRRETHRVSLLAAGVLGHSLGSFTDGVFSQFAGQNQRIERIEKAKPGFKPCTLGRFHLSLYVGKLLLFFLRHLNLSVTRADYAIISFCK